MIYNFNNYNSPFNIAAAELDINSDKLIKMLNNYFDRFKNATQSISPPPPYLKNINNPPSKRYLIFPKCQQPTLTFISYTKCSGCLKLRLSGHSERWDLWESSIKQR